jgi:hypothetical protein
MLQPMGADSGLERERFWHEWQGKWPEESSKSRNSLQNKARP